MTSLRYSLQHIYIYMRICYTQIIIYIYIHTHTHTHTHTMIICIKHSPLTGDNKILEKNFSCVSTDFLEFLPAKFNLNLAFVQLCISSYILKVRIYIFYIIWKHKIYTVFWINTGTCSLKNAGACSKYKFI